MTDTRCQHCGTQLGAGFSFCTQCGTPAPKTCRGCGFASPPNAVFCGGCGQPLERGSHGARARPSDAELRQLTVMFCDLVGSTDLSQRLDPEELREAIRAYQRYCGTWIERFEGHTAQYLGDGLLVYFGFPRAHEDDPARALRAALAIVDGLPELNTELVDTLPELRKRPLDVRIGVHTGPVVVGEMGDATHREELALGDTVNIAARLQGLGQPGWITISERTASRVTGQFVLEPLGPQELRGVHEPVLAYRALEPTRRTRARPGGALPLVGREHELELLLESWHGAAAGHGRVVLLRGEAGLGKSRLLEALRAHVEGIPHRWLQCDCSSLHADTAFHPVTELLREELQLDTKPARRELAVQSLTQSLQRSSLDPASMLPLIAPLLGLPVPDSGEIRALSHDALRRRTREALAEWLLRLGRELPLILVVEDLHWIDPSSLELLRLLVERVGDARLLVIATERPDREPSLPPHADLRVLELAPLTRTQTRALVETLAAGRSLPAGVLAQVATRTDGVPLFVEELTKSILESGCFSEDPVQGRDAAPLAIPSTLQDSLMARLDRLPLGKEVAQLASVIGREFPHALLAAVAPHDDITLEAALSELMEAELIYMRDEAPDPLYVFKHALVQDVAYQSMLRRKRRSIHARIAEALESKFPERAKQQPELLAHHYDGAAQLERAIDCHERAATRAAERSATAEAIAHLRRAIQLGEGTPVDTRRRRQACRLHVDLGARILELRGYGDPEIEQVYLRAIELCADDRGQGDEHFRALWGLSVFYQARTRLDEAVELGRQLVQSARHMEDPALELMAHQALGSPLLWQGRFGESLESVECAMRLYRPEQHRRLAHTYGEDPGISTRVYASQALWHLGHPDRALATIREAVELAEAGDHPFSLGYALCFLAVVHALRLEHEQAGIQARRALELAEAQELNLWGALGRFLLTWSEATPGSPPERAAPFDAAIGLMAATGTEVGTPFLLGMFADALRSCGQFGRALDIVRGARAIADQRQSPFWNADLDRLEGDLLLELGPSPDTQGQAEKLYRGALETAQRQGARSLALRAATRLAGLLAPRGGDPAEHARDLLRPILAGFDEGHDLADLRAARAALAS